MKKMENGIYVSDLTKTFGSKSALAGVSFAADRGEVFGLLGPSGAGKTTLIRILTGQLKPDKGTVMINGKNVRELKGSELAAFGIMTDSFGLYERLSCFDNLKVFAGIYKLTSDDIRRALQNVGLGEAAKTPACKLSKGMRVRLRLARAFMADPPILFLDEPTGGLDPVTTLNIHRMILKEKSRGKTIFLTTHNMSEAEKLCRKIAVLNRGSIIAYGSPAEITERYGQHKRIKIGLSSGEEREVPFGPEGAKEVFSLLSSGTAASIHSTEPDLEAVFTKITGEEAAIKSL